MNECISNVYRRKNGLNLLCVCCYWSSTMLTHIHNNTSRSEKVYVTCMLVWRLDTGEKTASRSVDSTSQLHSTTKNWTCSNNTLPAERNGYGAGSSWKEWEIKREPSWKGALGDSHAHTAERAGTALHVYCYCYGRGGKRRERENENRAIQSLFNRVFLYLSLSIAVEVKAQVVLQTCTQEA